MGLASRVEGVMVNTYSMFECNTFDGIEFIGVWKNFNLQFGYFLSIKGA